MFCYIATSIYAGKVMISWPILSSGLSERANDESVSTRTLHYTATWNLLLNLSDAFERIISSYKEVCLYVYNDDL